MKLKPGSTEVGVAVTLLNLSRTNSFGKEILAALGLEPHSNFGSRIKSVFEL